MVSNPPPCLWHQVRVHRVLSAPAGSDPAGLGGNPPSRPNSGADLAWPCAHPHAFFFNDFSLRFWSRFWSLPGGSLDSFWAPFWLHFLLKIPTHFWIVFLSVFWLIFKQFYIIFCSKIVPESKKTILRKWASRLHEVLIFKDLGSQNPSKNRWKITRKID